MFRKKSSAKARQKRHLRIRMRVSGTAERPRLAVFRSLKHMYAQLIDDTAPGGSRTLVAERAKAAGITSVVFDRGGYLYHGRVQKLADAAREAGLTF